MNQMKRYICLIVMSCFGLSAFGQLQTGLNRGDTVPDLVFRDMINFSAETATLADFEGKAVLIDFWATWCMPCVKSIPKLEDFQRKYRDDLQIIMVSADDEKRIKDFYSKKPDLILPTVIINDTVDNLKRLFPHREIPHYVWIGKDRTVYSITGSEEVTDENILKFILNEGNVHHQKNDSLLLRDFTGYVIDSIEKRLGRINSISINPNVIYQSSITGFDPRLTAVVSTSRPRLRNQIIEVVNASVVHLVKVSEGQVPADRIFLDISNPNLDYPNKYDGDKQEWLKQYGYSYRLILPKPDSALRYEIMKRDLAFVFGIKVTRQIKTVACLILRFTGDKNALRKSVDDSVYRNRSTFFGISISHGTVDNLMDVLTEYTVVGDLKRPQQQGIPIIDETGLSGKFSLDLDNIDFGDLKSLNERLNTVGFDLKVEDRQREMVVISDKQ